MGLRHQFVLDLREQMIHRGRPALSNSDHRNANQRFWAAGGYPVRPKNAGLVVILTLIHASAMLPPMTSLRQTG
jgi:hypothetical protein